MVELVVVALLALALGGALGSALAGRRTAGLASDLAVAQSRAADADLIRRTKDAVEAERNVAQQALSASRAEGGAHETALTAAREQLAQTTGKVEALEVARSQLAADLAALRSQGEARDEAHRANLDSLRTHFEAAAGQALEVAQTKFLDRAHQRFTESEKLQGEKIAQLLQPVNERLTRYEETVTKVEHERRSAFGELDGQIKAMREGQDRVSSEAAKLVNALRNAPKARGRWGEQQLRNVLESCGLSEHADFRTEVSVEGEEGGRLRPDVVVRIPGGKSLIIDAKVSLNAYQDAFGATEDVERQTGLAQHAAAMRAHVNGLGNKAYWAQFDDAPDYVIMFVPGEHFLSAALEHDSTLWDFAFDKRVLLATPTNLVAIARTVAAVWRQERLADEAREIGALGKELYDRLAKAMADLRVVGSGLNTAVKNYNSFVSSMNTRALVSARKLKDMNIEPGARGIEETPAVELLAGHVEGERMLLEAVGDVATVPAPA